MGRIDNLGRCSKAVIEAKMPPPLLCRASLDVKACGHLCCGLSFLAFLRPLPRTKEPKLELNIRYENGYQTISLDDAATNELWVSLSVDDEELDRDEESIQEAFEKQFNRPDYNSWHTFNRHCGCSYGEGDSEDAMDEVPSPESFSDFEAEMDAEESYAEVCRRVRDSLKPEWAELFIAVRIDGETIRNYTARIGESENNLTKKLCRAEKKLKEIFQKRQI